MEFDFLSPVDNEIIQFINGLSSQHLGSKVAFHTDKDFPDIDKVKIAIIGVLENRGALNFVDDEVRHRDAAPCVVRPLECRRVDDCREPVHALGLRATHRVGERSRAVDAVAVAVAGRDAGDAEFPNAAFRR